jgi:outer membrane protein
MKRLSFSSLLAVLAVVIVASGPPQGVLAQTSQAITFDEAVRIALEHNISLQRARNQVAMQAVDVDRARSRFLPDLRLGSGAQQRYGRNFLQEEGRLVDQTTESFALRGYSDINLFAGFADVANLQQARLRMEEADLRLDRHRQAVIFNVMSNYLALIERREQMRVQEYSLDLQQQQLVQIEEFTRVGTRPISDLYQQQAEVASAELALLTAERNFDMAQVALIHTLGLEPYGVYDFVIPELAEERLEPQRLQLDRLMQEAFAGRAELRAAEAAIAASNQGIRVARAGMFPRLGVGFDYGTNATSASSLSMTDQFDRSRGGAFGFSISIPLFDRFTTSTGVQQARVQHANAMLNLDEAQQAVALEVRQAYLDYLTAEKRLQVTEVQVAAARQALEATQERYRVGATTLLELARAVSGHIQAESNRVQATYDFLFREKLISYYLGSLDPQQPLF